MNLVLSEEQEMLRRTVREVMERYSTPADVRALEVDPKGYREDLWAELRKLDLLALPQEPSLMVEVAIVCEELGRALCASPYIESAVFGGRAVPDRAATGDIVTLAWHEPGGSDGPDGVRVTERDGRLSGEKILVPFGSSATVLLVLARGDEGVGLYAAEAADSAHIEPMGTLAKDARSLVRFDGTPVQRLGDWPAFEDATTPALVAVGAYAVGAAEAAHEMATAYANERIQFDRPIGSFQGIAHPLADTATEVAAAKTLVHQAAWAIAAGRANRPLAAMAKYFACDVARRTAKVGHQVFGGIGFTLDIDIQLYMRRTKQLEVTWFGPRALEEIIAGAELDAQMPLVTPDAVASGAR